MRRPRIVERQLSNSTFFYAFYQYINIHKLFKYLITMKKNILFLIAIFLLSIVSTLIVAQIKVAILEPVVETGQVSAIYKSVLRSKLVSSISNEDVNYEAFTRSDIDAIMREQHFQNNGILDEEIRIRLGNLGGVDCICVSKLTEGSGYINIDVMLVNVKSGKIESVANKLISNDLSELEETAIELGRKLVGLDRIEQERKKAQELELQRKREQEEKRQQEIEVKQRQEQLEAQERQRQLELQRMREEEERLKQEKEALQQQQQLDELNNSIANLGSAIAGAIQTANSYSIIFWNSHSSPRKITINGEIIGYVDGYSTKTFLVPIRLQGILQSTQTKGYLFSPTVETFEIKGVRKGQTIKLKN